MSEAINSQKKNKEVNSFVDIREDVMADEFRNQQVKAHIEAERVQLEEDPAMLLVKGKYGENKQYIKSLSHAIVTVISKFGYASLKCVGASSVNNAVKAFTIASGEAKVHGLDLVLSSGFQNAMFADVEKTAIVFKIFDR